ncbi:MAG: hypothetical protein LQ352_005168 [Teloschistes flavicans]|nr:MAG: hypothetical protein LQ352_005168 [Teloschistes flavicans]
MSSGVKPEFFVSTYTASQFYQPPPPKWFKMKTAVPKNLEKPARESLKALETLADMRTKLTGYDTSQIDLLIDHKININAQFTPRNAFDYPEEHQLERLSRLVEVRKKLAGTDYGLANLDAVLKAGFDNLIMATGISRSHSYLTARLPIISFKTNAFSIITQGPKSSVELFFNDRTRQITLYQADEAFKWKGNDVQYALRDVWKASWAEKSAKVCLHLFNADDLRYESCMMEMVGNGDARGFLQKMSGIANFKVVRLESDAMGELFARGPKMVKLPE